MDLREILVTFVFVGLGIGILVVFPVIAAILINRKGQKGWAIATIITTFIGYGWLIGLIGLTRPSRQEVTLLEKCPFCGGGTAISENKTVDKTTGNSITSIYGVIAWGLFGLIFIGFGIVMAILVWTEGDSGVIKWTYGPTIAGIGFLGIGFGFGRIGIIKVVEYIKADRVKTLVFRCSNCKNTWNQYSRGHKVSSQAKAQEALPVTPPPPPSPAEQQLEVPVVKDVCWFCQERKPADGQPYNIIIFKKQGNQRDEQIIKVPRCTSCQTFHMRKQPLIQVGITIAVFILMGLCILIGAVGSDTLGFWAWVIGTAVSLGGLIVVIGVLVAVNQRQSKVAGTRQAATANSEFPQVKQLINQGWQLDTVKSSNLNK